MIQATRYELILLVFSYFWFNSSFAQEVEDIINPKNKNVISIKYGLYEFYDGMPIAYKNVYTNHTQFSKGYGLKYFHQINNKYSWSIECDIYYHDRQQLRSDYKSGTVDYKNFFTIQGSFQRFLINSNRNKLSSSAGLMLRVGEEFLHGGFYGGVPGPGLAFSSHHIMRDIGIPIGLHYYYYMGKHFHLTVGLEHTFFPYVYASKNNLHFDYEWDNGTSRNMTKLQFGLGVNF